MSPRKPTDKVYWGAGIGLAIVALLIVYPPFHVRRIDAPGDVATPPAFDAPRAAADFWRKHIARAGEGAVDLADLAAILAAGGGEKLGRRTSVGSEPVFVVKGSGRVVATDPRSVRLAIEGSEAQVSLRVGPVFGNVLRDAFESAEVAALSSFDANALSGEINKIAETTIQPRLVAVAKTGQRLSFVGGAQRRDTRDGGMAFVVVPVAVEVVP
jgi:predicted lipoprotein